MHGNDVMEKILGRKLTLTRLIGDFVLKIKIIEL